MKANKKFNRMAAYSSVVAVLAMTAPAHAQSAADEADAQVPTPGVADIVVTAQRRSENLQNVAIAVTAIDADTLKSAGATSIEDVKSLAPGLNITTIGGTYILPRIRGVGTTVGAAGVENPVATYVDGVYFASATGSLLSLNNIAQVAVLKGPQGTLFGRNATGGLIQITTFDPQYDFSGSIEGTYGNKDTIGGSLYVTGGLGASVAADLAVYYRDQQDGFGTNLVNGNDVNKARSFAIRSKIKFDIGPDTSLKLSGDYSDSRAALAANRPLYGTIPVGGVPFTGGKFDVNGDIDPVGTTYQYGGSATLEHRIAGVRVSTITAYRHTRSRFILDSDKTPAPILKTDVIQVDDQFSQELQLVSDTPGPFQWTAGAYYFRGKGAYEPIRLIRNGGAVIQTIPTEQKTRSIAVYGQGSYQLSDALKFTAGLRYTDDKQDFQGSFSRTNAAGTVLLVPATPFHTSAGKATWRLALDYRFSPEALGYLSYNRGFKSGGFNPQDLTDSPFAPEVLDAYEAGLKLDLADRRLRINPSVFYYDYKNLQVSAFVNGTFRITNAATAEIYGLDMDAIAAVTDNFKLTAGLSVLHARYKQFNGATITTPVPNGAGNIISVGSASGNRITNTPDWTLNLAADYSVPMGNGELQLHADYYYNDGWYPEADNRTRQPNYSLFGASVAYLFADGKYSVRVFGKNLTNKAYATQMNSQDVGDSIGMAPGRTYGIILGTKF